MLETLANIDRDLFLFLNGQLANPVTDLIMPIVTSDNILRVMYAVAMALVLWKGNARARWLVLASVMVLTVSDQLSSSLLKPMIGRLRPCHVLDGINLLVGCGGGKSMPSSHAANSFGQAILFSLQYRFLRWPLITFAGVVSISRIFVGVHYPGDVLVGAVVGTIVAVIFSLIFTRVYDYAVTNYRERKARHAA